MKKPIKINMPNKMRRKNKGATFAIKYEYGQFLGEFELVVERELNSIYTIQPIRFRVACKDGREFIGEDDGIHHHIKSPYLKYEAMEESAFKKLVHAIETAYIQSLPYMDRKVREIAPKTMAIIQTGPNTAFEFETRKK